MRIVRYQIGDEAPQYGWLHENKIGDIEGDLFGKYKRLEAKTPLTDVKLLAPAVPEQDRLRGTQLCRTCQGIGQ